ncbi:MULTISPECIES: hypothetical protein [Edwardsiella]|uniref:Gifsy-1 prophage protein n=2 Tax=Edwardsiella anguillarum TaxID=1821960 RepID=A0A076LNG0_9GAMM|nr:MULTISPECIES: hypothetical protein [Edwardsiella]AIJ10080.1 Gifsy-1 prophage protein [Edwardsiella anguillarum ET080813]AKR79389.1 hypothetical protein AAZ33_08450 [Edwardsiella sp. LADL05-105]KAB0589726.1 hypothetical protein F7P84_13465 [Edwardsiella anguillarum]UOU80783.1 hypothetical protein MUN71_09600 [Edwardsiella anguillarum]WHP81843.1 hypothetical protein MQ090_08460 [Edwardsiella anguillarum]
MKHHALFALCLLGCSTFAPTYAVYAADASGITQHAVQFPKGGSEATIKSRIKGENVLDYTLIAAKGQHISITLNGASTTYFNLMAPGSTGEALFNGAQDGDSYQGILPAKGRYTVRIYQMGAAKQSSAAHPFTLKVGITGTAAPQTEKASAASGKLPCAQQSGQPMGQCPFSVTRTAPGEATVTITMPDHRQRTLFFAHGKPLTADLSQADGDMTFTWHQESDLFLIRAGHERYEIPEAIISGG